MPSRKPTTGPLQGIRILDLTRLLPGPLGMMMMADMGAEVIKIEDPKNPDYVRHFPPYLNGESANYLAFNRSKKSIVLDFSSHEGKQIFLQLVETADIVVEQFRPHFLDKIGIGYEEAKKVNPKIIYVSITGYGQTGPYANLAGHDLNYTAVAGVLGVTGNNPDEAPTVAGVQIADIAGGSYMCIIASLSAIYARNQTGVGQHVDVSMTDCVMPLLTAVYPFHQAIISEITPSFTENNEKSAGKRVNFPLSGGLPNYGIYKTSDNKFIALGTLEPKFWSKFCQLTQKPEWVDFILPKNNAELAAFKAKISQLFATKSRNDWVEFGTKNDLLITPVNGLNELQEDLHLQARNMIIEEEHPKAGRFNSIGVPLKFSETPAKPSWVAPDLGEDTEEILRELGHE